MPPLGSSAPRGRQAQVDRTGWSRPWVQLKYFTLSPAVYPRFIAEVSREAAAGDWVTVYDPNGACFGAGFFHPEARVPLRVLVHGPAPAPESRIDEALEQALSFRLEHLRLAESTQACRLVNSDGDLLGGLTVDLYGPVLSVEVSNLGMARRLPRLLPRILERSGAQSAIVRAPAEIARLEGIDAAGLARLGGEPPRRVKFQEGGVRWEVDFEEGHKTGFFCDQRDNRARFASLARGARVLDLCCYTGGFAISAIVRGEAAEVTGVDLDEDAVSQARRNANLNQVTPARAQWVHADAYAYARQMHRNGSTWDAVALDPPKFVLSREEEGEGGLRDGRRRYEDLNSLGIQLVRPGGVFVTCSCSGLLAPELFEEIVSASAHRVGRRLQFFDRTGPGLDHPVLSSAPEGRYLKVLWARVW